MIEARRLCKRFGSVAAVQDASFMAKNGEVTGLLGPNGAGKSTCLRMIYGVLTPDSGSAAVDGLDIRGETSAARARLGVLPHAAGLYANLTARENIAYFGTLRGMGGALIRERTEELARSLDMGAFIDRRTKGMSQGQRIKIALARALVNDPGNLVLDEPTNGLDVMAIRNLREMLLRLRTRGRCILFSSHVMQEVAALCDRVVIIGRGRVLADDTPDVIRRQTGAASLEEAFLHVLGRAEGVR
jgi:sodium transport system ATP-binding protein